MQSNEWTARSAPDLYALDGITFAYELDGGWGLEGRLIVAGVQLDFRQRHSGGGVVDGGFNGADRRIQCGLCKLALKNFPDFPGKSTASAGVTGAGAAWGLAGAGVSSACPTNCGEGRASSSLPKGVNPASAMILTSALPRAYHNAYAVVIGMIKIAELSCNGRRLP